MLERNYQDKKIFAFEPGDIIYKCGDEVQFLAMVVEGEINAQTTYGTISLGVGDMIGISDIWFGRYGFDYVAETDVKVCMYAFHEASLLKPIFGGEKKYLSVSVLSALRVYKQQFHLQNQWYQRGKRAYGKVKVSYEKYKNYVKKYNIKAKDLEYIDVLEPVNSMYVPEAYTEAVVSELSLLSLEAIEGFLGNAPYTAMNFLKQMEESCCAMGIAAEKCMSDYENIGNVFFGAERDNLYSAYYEMALSIKEGMGEIQPIIQELEGIHSLSCSMDQEFAGTAGVNFISQTEKIQDAMDVLRSSEEKEDAMMITEYTVNQMAEAQSAFADLTNKLLAYAEMPEAQKQEFADAMTAFRMLVKNQFRAQNAVKIIHEFEALFYELYEAVFQRKEKEGNAAPFWLTLFLDYAIISDADFSKEEQVRIYNLIKERTYEGKYNVFTISQWLHKIYIGEREPSRDELGRDYKEFLLELKKKRSMSQEEELEYHRDMMRKVKFEIKNFFRPTSRIVYSANATFCPFMIGDELSGNITESILSYERVVQLLDKIRSVDFSAFYREYSYYDEQGQDKAIRLMTEVFPDIILIPHVGYRGSMWQEIEGRKRVSPARFALPLYPQGDLYEMLLNVVGKYRWEFCRTEQGVRWNDISERSLTSEYYDYIQFYKKNNDLSDVMKQKIKDKLNRFRNNTSEVFVADYISWIKYEAEGANRLNKVCRGIMAEYCIFSKELRAGLKQNPMFGEVIEKIENKRKRKENEFSRYLAAIEKRGIKPSPELLEHLKFLQS